MASPENLELGTPTQLRNWASESIEGEIKSPQMGGIGADGEGKGTQEAVVAGIQEREIGRESNRREFAREGVGAQVENLEIVEEASGEGPGERVAGEVEDG